MRFTVAQKAIATSAAALGVVLGAAGITAAATDSGTSPAQQQSDSNHEGDFTPPNEQGKPEPAESETAANDPDDANGANGAASEKAEGPEAADPGGTNPQDAPDSETGQAPAATTTASAGQG
jgi:hypothetical protein